MNGHIIRISESSFRLGVEQSFGNCPKYIQLRSMKLVDDPGLPYTGFVEEMEKLDTAARHLVSMSDTFFVASYIERNDGSMQVDVSHRGGPAGFISVMEDGSIIIPEFMGNRFYNTLGNFLVNPRGGLVFINDGQLLQMTGACEIIHAGQIQGFEEAEMYWKFSPKRIIRRNARLPLTFDILERADPLG